MVSMEISYIFDLEHQTSVPQSSLCHNSPVWATFRPWLGVVISLLLRYRENLRRSP